jgi:hypothetical protein
MYYKLILSDVLLWNVLSFSGISVHLFKGKKPYPQSFDPSTIIFGTLLTWCLHLKLKKQWKVTVFYMFYLKRKVCTFNTIKN